MYAFQGLRAVACFVDSVALGLKHSSHDLSYYGLVIYDQDVNTISYTFLPSARQMLVSSVHLNDSREGAAYLADRRPVLARRRSRLQSPRTSA
jgi:hypothetical protein